MPHLQLQQNIGIKLEERLRENPIHGFIAQSLSCVLRGSLELAINFALLLDQAQSAIKQIFHHINVTVLFAQ